MKNNPKNIYEATIKRDGSLFQFDLLIEECSELIRALSKAKRTKVITSTGAFINLGEETNPSQYEAYKNFCEEFAHVEMVMEKVRLILPDHANEKIAKLKQERLDILEASVAPIEKFPSNMY